MIVVFGFDSSRSRVIEVIWEDDGVVKSRMLLSDGSTKEEVTDAVDLKEAMNEFGGAYAPMYPAEVDDLRSAFKYLGKASDLAETLPEAELGPIEPGAAA